MDFLVDFFNVKVGTTLTKFFLVPLWLIASALNSYSRFWCYNALIILNEEIEDIMKIVKSLGYSGLLIKGVNHTTENESK